jgi:diadenosine tetraphosphate (Ap4A) HIT family hydrolase
MSDFTLHSMLVRDAIELAQLPLSTLLLSNDSQYPWFILVPRVSDIKDIYQLNWEDQQQLLNESSLLSEVLMQVFNGEKMNVGALGNLCPQLHLHHIVRYTTDIAWPKPIWGLHPTIAYTDKELVAIKNKVMPALTAVLAKSA